MRAGDRPLPIQSCTGAVTARPEEDLTSIPDGGSGSPGRFDRVRREITERLALTYRSWARRRQLTDPADIARWAWEFVNSRRYCLMVTAAEDGPAARVLEPFAPRDGLIRLGTDPASRKVADIRRTGRCLLVYQDDRRRACVTLDCEATVQTEGHLPFKPAWRSFWAAGPDQTYVAITCRPVALEAWSATAVIAPEPFGRRSARLVRQGDRWEFEPTDRDGGRPA